MEKKAKDDEQQRLKRRWQKEKMKERRCKTFERATTGKRNRG